MKLNAIQTGRFWSRIDRTAGPTACWPWMRGKNKGYGVFNANGIRDKAHRVAYELLVGPVPVGMTLDHTCHNGSGCPGGDTCPHRACCNPAHLEPVPHEVNVSRGQAGINFRVRTHCPFGHEYDDANTGTQGKGRGGNWRFCRECNRRRMANRRALAAGLPAPYPEY